MWPYVASFRAAAFAFGVVILAKVGCMCPEQLLAVMIFDFEFGVPCVSKEPTLRTHLLFSLVGIAIFLAVCNSRNQATAISFNTRPDVLYSYKSYGRWASNYDRPHVPAHFGAVHVFDEGPIAGSNAEYPLPLQSSASLMQIGQAVAQHSVQVAG